MDNNVNQPQEPTLAQKLYNVVKAFIRFFAILLGYAGGGSVEILRECPGIILTVRSSLGALLVAVAVYTGFIFRQILSLANFDDGVTALGGMLIGIAIFFVDRNYASKIDDTYIKYLALGESINSIKKWWTLDKAMIGGMIFRVLLVSAGEFLATQTMEMNLFETEIHEYIVEELRPAQVMMMQAKNDSTDATLRNEIRVADSAAFSFYMIHDSLWIQPTDSAIAILNDKHQASFKAYLEEVDGTGGSGRATRGPIAQEKWRKVEADSAALTEAKAAKVADEPNTTTYRRFVAEQTEADSTRARLTRKMEELDEDLERRIETFLNKPFGLSERRSALWEVEKENIVYAGFFFAFLFTFVMLFTIIKTFLGASAYHVIGAKFQKGIFDTAAKEHAEDEIRKREEEADRSKRLDRVREIEDQVQAEQNIRIHQASLDAEQRRHEALMQRIEHEIDEDLLEIEGEKKVVKAELDKTLAVTSKSMTIIGKLRQGNPDSKDPQLNGIEQDSLRSVGRIVRKALQDAEGTQNGSSNRQLNS